MLTTKTLLAGAIAVLVANQASALNESTQDQTGSDNYADVMQQNGTDNLSSQVQDGDANVVYTLQNGSELTSTSEQRGVGNLTTIEQDGRASQADVSQDGSYNRATVYQAAYGDIGHTVAISQVGTDNLAYIEQIDGAANSATIDQDGLRNVVDASQQLTANHLGATQVGEDNTLLVEQLGNSSAYTSQTGTANAIDLQQDGGFSGASATISQNGTATRPRSPSNPVSTAQVTCN